MSSLYSVSITNKIDPKDNDWNIVESGVKQSSNLDSTPNRQSSKYSSRLTVLLISFTLHLEV
jgi:hypothetical protein